MVKLGKRRHEDGAEVLTVPRSALTVISEPRGAEAEAEGSNTAYLLFQTDPQYTAGVAENIRNL